MLSNSSLWEVKEQVYKEEWKDEGIGCNQIQIKSNEFLKREGKIIILLVCEYFW